MTKVLLIEDDPRLGGQLKPAIQDAGYQCDWVRSMRAARSAQDTSAYDLLLLDLNLPDGSGFDLLEDVRKMSKVPVIIISARAQGQDKVKALDLGADDYLTKPFWSEELAARIRAILRRQAPAVETPKTFQFGDVVLDFEARIISVGNKRAAVTPTEFDLLEFFVRRPCQALRRERIIDAVFKNPDSATEALQTHVSRLRRKLGKGSAALETIWGIGYRFDPSRVEDE